MGSKVHVGILNLEDNRSIENDYKFNFKQANIINYSEYQKNIMLQQRTEVKTSKKALISH